MKLPAQITINGVLQDYAWGGTSYLSNLLGLPEQTAAEYWLGDHPKGPAAVVGADESLATIIVNNPVESLGAAVSQQFGKRLPYLFKILDVQQMLSIQVHPDKGTAEAGFAREEAARIPRMAPNRNYRDDNHKPELGVAISDFYLLHGFREEAAIANTLREVPGWADLHPILFEEGVAGLYQHVMEADQATIDQLLQPLAAQIPTAPTNKLEPDYWTRRAISQYSKQGHHDRGIFSIYWFNIVHLRPGEAIFQDAGIPHAYLEGKCFELMANSDNVLRGGLTPKHIDVAELLLNTSTEAVTPQVLRPVQPASGWAHYPTPAPDFSLQFLTLTAGSQIELEAKGPEIIFLFSGACVSATADNASSIQLNPNQRSVFLPSGTSVIITASESSVIYRAGVK